MKNLSLKIWSILIAILISYFVHSQTNTGLITLVVPVELRNIPVHKVVLLPNVSQARITLRAPSHLLSEIAQSPPSFLVHVPEEIGNRYLVTLQENAIDLPKGVEVLNIEPSEIEYILDDLVEKRVQVVVPRIGDPGEGFSIDKISLTPSEVVLNGASTELSGLKTVETAPLDLRTLHGDTEKVLPLRLQGRFVKSKTDKITLSVKVKQQQTERTFKDVPVQIRGELSEQYLVAPTKVTVQVTGPLHILKNFSADNVVPFIDITESSAAGPRLVQIDTGNQAKIVSIKPSKVTLKKRNL